MLPKDHSQDLQMIKLPFQNVLNIQLLFHIFWLKFLWLKFLLHGWNNSLILVCPWVRFDFGEWPMHFGEDSMPPSPTWRGTIKSNGFPWDKDALLPFLWMLIYMLLIQLRKNYGLQMSPLPLIRGTVFEQSVIPTPPSLIKLFCIFHAQLHGNYLHQSDKVQIFRSYF